MEASPVSIESSAPDLRTPRPLRRSFLDCEGFEGLREGVPDCLLFGKDTGKVYFDPFIILSHILAYVVPESVYSISEEAVEYRILWGGGVIIVRNREISASWMVEKVVVPEINVFQVTPGSPSLYEITVVHERCPVRAREGASRLLLEMLQSVRRGRANGEVEIVEFVGCKSTGLFRGITFVSTEGHER